jgi:FlaA1/EpsC-like NDP-sugar epimerase
LNFIKTIRDFEKYFSKRNGMGVDYLFHAGLKQVPSCEFTRLQTLQTNIMGLKM